MRHRMTMKEEDRVNHLIGRCLRNREEARQLYETLVSGNKRKVYLLTGTVHLTDAEHDEFVARFSAEIEPTMWESSMRKH